MQVVAAVAVARVMPTVCPVMVMAAAVGTGRRADCGWHLGVLAALPRRGQSCQRAAVRKQCTPSDKQSWHSAPQQQQQQRLQLHGVEAWLWQRRRCGAAAYMWKAEGTSTWPLKPPQK
jgi:hypothetical protein